MKSILLDAGPQIALFAVDDAYHGHYDTLVSDGSVEGLRLLTTWPCVVEACYLLGLPQRYELLRWIELGGALVYPFEARHLADMVSWMEGLLPSTAKVSVRGVWLRMITAKSRKRSKRLTARLQIMITPMISWTTVNRH